MAKVLVTGANKGIGFAISKQLGLCGWHVLVGARSRERGEKAVYRLKAMGVKEVEWVEVNLSDLEAIRRSVKLIKDSHPDLEMLVNNAGIPGNMECASYESDMEDIIETVKVNYIGTYALTKGLVPVIARNRGRIVNITVPTSVNPYWNPLAYKASKAAQNVMTATMGFDFDKNKVPVEIFCVHPGPTTTDLNGNMTGEGFHTPEVVAGKFMEIINDGKRHQGEFIEIFPIVSA
ncbi:MAG: SDR family NAD(P)-dependent oxidoreductase [Prevotella sp.]|jgi:NAD(P)-dependent dehydrogenase (short-subunit alcohol dehydrogenase family)|nr:SDR family NAD(P)-dependent oxidoreductase [Prevotella sp.]MCH4017084.1 SDR family NAD(P)-dependent oxidoreductase [Prevotella sp.]MCI1291842.1 SDR family NAD(P)-dependent oxidoreductase [Prevotella sp.]MCI1324748.1 SDR family NAD(P)-dependent oxidoreductase [Prevotella sp.]MCI1415783.1 SDR family NAD(P)-dependent oxidoreductase [Prevotella sp.]